MLTILIDWKFKIIIIIIKIKLTCGEDVIPPIRLADVSFEIVGRFGHDDVRRSDNSPDRQKYGKDGHNDAESLDQIEIGDFDGFG
jgi:hypothetical protein